MTNKRMSRNIKIQTDELDNIKIAYDKADGSRNKDQLKKKWYDKIKSIAAQIRQNCGKKSL